MKERRRSTMRRASGLDPVPREYPSVYRFYARDVSPSSIPIDIAVDVNSATRGTAERNENGPIAAMRGTAELM